MELTVGNLRKIIEELDDDIVLADFGFGNTDFIPHSNIKRLMLMQGNDQWDHQTFLVINRQGSHFSGEGDQKNITFLGKHWQ